MSGVLFSLVCFALFWSLLFSFDLCCSCLLIMFYPWLMTLSIAFIRCCSSWSKCMATRRFCLCCFAQRIPARVASRCIVLFSWCDFGSQRIVSLRCIDQRCIPRRYPSCGTLAVLCRVRYSLCLTAGDVRRRMGTVCQGWQLMSLICIVP